MKKFLVLTLSIVGMLMVYPSAGRAQTPDMPEEYGTGSQQYERQRTVADDGATASFPMRLQSTSGSVVIVAPALLLQRATSVAGGAVKPAVTAADATEEIQDQVKTKGGKSVGYRVQVYADNSVRNAKTEARQRERALEQAFPEYATYVSYASPYWRLRVGDFRSQYEAEKAAAEIRKQFPRYAKEVRVVRDKVTVR